MGACFKCAPTYLSEIFTMTSMKDVAKRAGVNVSTVSRVLSKKTPVSKQTEDKVNAAVKELGYRTNILASGLRSRSGEIIGLVVPMINNSVFSEFIHWIEIECTQRGYALIVANSHGDPESENRFVDNIMSRFVDGIIISQVSEESTIVNYLDKSQIPVVLFDRVTDVESIMTVTVDNELAGEMAADALIQSGCKNIACITGPLNIDVFQKRKQGFEKIIRKQQESGSHISYDYEISQSLQESGESSADRLIARSANLDGIWAQTDLLAAGVIRSVLSKGMKIPEDFKVIGMDNTDISRATYPSITSISQPYKAMAEQAVEMIFARKNKSEISESHLMISPEIVYRESLPVFDKF